MLTQDPITTLGIYCKITLLATILYFGSHIYLLAKIFTLGSLRLTPIMHCVFETDGQQLLITNCLHSYGFALIYFY